MGRRIEWVDLAKGLGFICVILAHLDSNTDLLTAIYMPFVLNIFLFASGYTYKSPGNFPVLLKKKVLCLLVPWFFFSNFNILFGAVFSFHEHESLVNELLWNLIQIRAKGDGMWFIAAIFVAYIPFYFLIRWYEGRNIDLKRKNREMILVVFLLYLIPGKIQALPWHIEYIPQELLFMAFGYLFRKSWESILDSYINKRNLIFICAVYILAVLCMHNLPVSGSLTAIRSFCFEMIGVVVMVMVCKGIKGNRFILFVGQNTLTYFGLHGKALSIVQILCQHLLGEHYQQSLDNIFLSSIMAVILALLISAILIVPALIMNRYFPFILGKKKIVKHL